MSIAHGLKGGFIDYELKDSATVDQHGNTIVPESLWTRHDDPDLVKMESQYRGIALVHLEPGGPLTATLVRRGGFWCIVCGRGCLPSAGSAQKATVSFYCDTESSFARAEGHLLPELVFEEIEEYGLVICAISRDPLEEYSINPIPWVKSEEHLESLQIEPGCEVELVAHAFSEAKELTPLELASLDLRTRMMSFEDELPTGIHGSPILLAGCLLGFVLQPTLDEPPRLAVMAVEILGSGKDIVAKEIHEKDSNLSEHEILKHVAKAIEENNIEVLVSAREELGEDKFSTLATRDGRSLCHIAAQFGNEFGMIVLRELGADMRIQSKMGDDLMLTAAYNGNLNIMIYLRNKGFHLGSRNRMGQTVAHKAALRGHIHVLRWLLTQGIDLLLGDKKGKNPLDLAHEMFLESVVQFYEANDLGKKVPIGYDSAYQKYDDRKDHENEFGK